MIGANKLFCATTGAIDETRPAMAADIGKGAQACVYPAHNDHTLADIIDGMPVAWVCHIANMTHHLPARAEDAVDFNMGKFGIVIGPRWQTPAIHRILSQLEVLDACHNGIVVIQMYNKMQAARSSFTRESADARREALIEACARSLARNGVQGTSVRLICTDAGVSPGLLRHYFDGVDALIAATYRWTGARVQEALAEAVAAAQTPRARLLAYLTASFAEPIADAELLATWLAFWALTKTDPHIAALHHEIYRDYRADLEALLADCQHGDHRLTAVALTALVDGLWLELSLGNAPFTPAQANALVEKWMDSLLQS
jgi:TetR/AcrR family transcriptional regulator, transcriptional repressor of bet genes